MASTNSWPTSKYVSQSPSMSSATSSRSVGRLYLLEQVRAVAERLRAAVRAVSDE
ncbi:hypothetical protein [Nesterenkonia pannonica]|uniref:hypothetical protein n=1 Tax=Nesterenkonia pannonica TaxID=1548602 RepID=UPI00216452EF|nr:hypothetical protein [Nesterenkonia pannonica]